MTFPAAWTLPRSDAPRERSRSLAWPRNRELSHSVPDPISHADPRRPRKPLAERSWGFDPHSSLHPLVGERASERPTQALWRHLLAPLVEKALQDTE
jgi:hypothetical protein